MTDDETPVCKKCGKKLLHFWDMNRFHGTNNFNFGDISEHPIRSCWLCEDCGDLYRKDESGLTFIKSSEDIE
jgi:hypothetical protein